MSDPDEEVPTLTAARMRVLLVMVVVPAIVFWACSVFFLGAESSVQMVPMLMLLFSIWTAMRTVTAFREDIGR